MRLFQTPGVHLERTDAAVGGVVLLRTDIAGFVGIADRGPLHLAVPVESYRQFQAWFGDTIDNGYLAYCARAYFENGGRRLWVVRVASDAAAAAGVMVSDDGVPAGPGWTIEASSPGVWGRNLSVRLAEVRRAQVRAVVDEGDPRRLRVPSLAGLGAGALVEARQPGLPPARAVVMGAEASTARLLIDRALTGLDPARLLRLESVAYDLEVYEDGRLVALVSDLSLVPEHPRYGPALLKQPWQAFDPRDAEAEPAGSQSAAAIDHFRVGRSRRGEPPPPVVVRERRSVAARRALRLLGQTSPAPLRPLLGGDDGLTALAARDFMGERIGPQASDEAVALARRGLAALDVVDEVGVLAAPDINIRPRPVARHVTTPCEPDTCLPLPSRPAAPRPRAVGDQPPLFSEEDIAAVQASMIAQCETRRDRVALLDAPFESCTRLTLAASGLQAWRRRFESPFGALYAPWLEVVDPLRLRTGTSFDRLTRPVPPCGHVAGSIAASDLARGVHAAPANVPLRWMQGPTLDLDPERHGLLNALGVNLVRAEPGRGTRVLGARTVSSDTDWRFLNVRRLVSMVAKAIDSAIQWAVFEPNDWRTRAKLTLAIGSFLQELWTRGALVGTTPEQAFFVRCDETNNPPDQRARGQLLIEVGLAPSVPFEFILLRIGRDADAFALTEAGAGRSLA